jgi:NifU-like protein involved in Fe-S cluster formation
MTTMVRDRTTDAARRLAAAFEQFVAAPPAAAPPAAPNAAPADPAVVDGDDQLGELRAFAGVRRFRSRRVCATLGFRALLRALDAPETTVNRAPGTR